MNNNEKLAGEEGLSSKLWSSSDQGTLFADVVDFKTSYLDAAAALEALLEAVAIHRSRHIFLVQVNLSDLDTVSRIRSPRRSYGHPWIKAHFLLNSNLHISTP